MDSSSPAASPAPTSPAAGIRERLKALPKPGQIVPTPVEGLGDVPIKLLSYGEILALPDKLAGLHHAVAAVMDEDGRRLFGSVSELEALHPAVGDAFVRACTKASTLSPAAAKKK